MLNPVAFESLLGVLKPDHLALVHFSIGAGRKEILASVVVEVDPFTHVVEIALLLGGDLRGGDC